MSLSSHYWDCTFKEKELNLARSSSSQQRQECQRCFTSSRTICWWCHWIVTTYFSPREFSDCTQEALWKQQTNSQWLRFLEPLEVGTGINKAKHEHMMQSGRAVQYTETVFGPKLQNTYQRALPKGLSAGTGHLSSAPTWNTCCPTEIKTCYSHFFLRVKNYFLSQQKQKFITNIAKSQKGVIHASLKNNARG